MTPIHLQLFDFFNKSVLTRLVLDPPSIRYPHQFGCVWGTSRGLHFWKIQEIRYLIRAQTTVMEIED